MFSSGINSSGPAPQKGKGKHNIIYSAAGFAEPPWNFIWSLRRLDSSSCIY
jgi:hypothetical protein